MSSRTASPSDPPAAVAVIGAGSWGTAVAALAAANVPTRLWARAPELVERLNRSHQNPQYLPGIVLPASLATTAVLEEAVAGARIVVMGVPSHGFRRVLEQLAPFLAPEAVVISLVKGIEAGTNLRMSEVVAEVAPDVACGVLAGPNLAREIAAGQPAASVVAVAVEELGNQVQRALHSRTFRVYTGSDVVGCEIAGATKNVIAIAAGISDGLGFGENTRAVLVTRGLAEMGRLGITLGGQTLTFGGLAGVGDLVATCSSSQSRNRTVGFELGRGGRLAAILEGLHMVAEGVKTAGPLARLADEHGVEMPIVEQVAAIVDGRRDPAEAHRSLMGRPARAEWDETLMKGLLR